MILAFSSIRHDNMFLNTVYLGTKKFGTVSLYLPWWIKYTKKGRKIIQKVSKIPGAKFDILNRHINQEIYYVRFEF